MSGLEKFQASEALRTNIKKFLFMERNPALLQQTKTVNETQRYSFDIGEDLKNILEQKKKQKVVKFNLDENNSSCHNNTTPEKKQEKEDTTTMSHLRPASNYEDDTLMCDKSFEALEKMCEKTASDHDSTLFKYLTKSEEQKDERTGFVWQRTSDETEISSDKNYELLKDLNKEDKKKYDHSVMAFQKDESFEALEKMCDKTASDPNSTLFEYINSDNKEIILAKIKKRSLQNHQNDPLLYKLSNCTLLDDVEEPSRMWENTICTETIIQTSPVKMVGLLRPSTIIEEAPDASANSDISSQLSFETATKGAPSDVSSSVYDTAHDSTVASSRTDASSNQDHRDHLDQLEVIDVDDILSLKFAQSNEKDLNIPSVAIENNTSTSGDDSIDLIDLDKTFGALPTSPHTTILDNTIFDVENFTEQEKNEPCQLDDEENIHSSYDILDESIIEILSDDDNDDNSDEIKTNEKQIDEDPMQFAEIKSEENSKSSLSINQDTFSFNQSSVYEENKENCEEVNESSNKSMQFNDTMEEVEYMLKKHTEYIAAEAAAKEVSNENKVINSPVIKIQKNSPIIKKKPAISQVKTSNYITPAKQTPLTKYGGSSSKKRYDDNIAKPFPKLDIFAKPTHARHKELTSKQQKFSHIVSPIGAYMKKTGTTPLMSSMRNKNKQSDLLNSTAFRELENESRLYQPKFETKSGATEGTGLAGLSGAHKTFPKKAYISSELKHIVDERTPVTIPGGKKIQKYLENAMMPAVLRHDGKVKIPGGINNKLNTLSSPKLPLKSPNSNSAVAGGNAGVGGTSHIPRRNNASLADLSLMSGDVSMYTIMDAQKF